MTEFLQKSASPERKVFIETIVTEIVVILGKAVVAPQTSLMTDDIPTHENGLRKSSTGRAQSRLLWLGV